jgi:Zn finger protein HypA/HybF involved in hydrogenase expression
MSAARIILCETCGSEGRIIRGQYEDERDCGPCPACDGTGLEVVETEPIQMTDIDVDDYADRAEWQARR